MKRREFIALLGGATTWPLAGRAQQPTIPVIGFLSGRSPDDSIDLVEGLRRGLSQEGYVEGKNVAIEYRWAEGHFDRLPTLVADLLERHVVMIAAVTTPAALAAKGTTSNVPIVFVAGGDPVNLGLVIGLSRPGGNITGVSILTFELLPKRIQLIREMVPNVTRISVLINPTAAVAEQLKRQVDEAAHTFERSIVVLKAGSQAEFDSVFKSLAQQQVGALVVAPDPFFNGHGEELGKLAARYSIPAIAEVRGFTAAGGLASYGPSFTDAYRQTGVYAGRILKGAHPTDLPVMQPTKFELVINLTTAKTLGLTIPESIILRADEVVE